VRGPGDSLWCEDVAAALVEIIERPQVNRVIIELTEGDMPVDQAIQRLATV